MLPVQDTNVVAEAVALLTSRYASDPVTKGLVTALELRAQEIENVLFDVIFKIQLANQPLAGGPWDVLDKIGAIVGIPRNGLDDASYLAAIRIKIRVNRSNGLAEDIIQIAALIVTGAAYREWYPASWEIDAFDVTAAVALALVSYLGEADSAGTEGFVRYSTWSTGIVVFASNVGTVANAAGFKDSVGGGFPNALVSLQVT